MRLFHYEHPLIRLHPTFPLRIPSRPGWDTRRIPLFAKDPNLEDTSGSRNARPFLLWGGMSAVTWLWASTMFCQAPAARLMSMKVLGSAAKTMKAVTAKAAKPHCLPDLRGPTRAHQASRCCQQARSDARLIQLHHQLSPTSKSAWDTRLGTSFHSCPSLESNSLRVIGKSRGMSSSSSDAGTLQLSHFFPIIAA